MTAPSPQQAAYRVRESYRKGDLPKRYQKVRKWMAGADRGIVSAGPEHVLPAPVALGMLLLFNEVKNSSGD